MRTKLLVREGRFEFFLVLYALPALAGSFLACLFVRGIRTLIYEMQIKYLTSKLISTGTHSPASRHKMYSLLYNVTWRQQLGGYPEGGLVWSGRQNHLYTSSNGLVSAKHESQTSLTIFVA